MGGDGICGGLQLLEGWTFRSLGRDRCSRPSDLDAAADTLALVVRQLGKPAAAAHAALDAALNRLG